MIAHFVYVTRNLQLHSILYTKYWVILKLDLIVSLII